MNGFGLLIAVAALGVDVGWEMGPGGQSYYTIHIEELLLDPLREGQAIVSNVDSNDRNLTRFQILVGDHAHAISSQAGPSGRDVVQHGWRPGEKGGTDYLIQISPERLESLAKGSMIIGQIDPQVTDIRKLYVFSGVQQLPQQLAPPSGPPQPPKFLDAGGDLRSASAETAERSEFPTRDGAAQSNGTQSNGTQFHGTQFNGTQFNGTQTSDGQSTGAGRAGDFPAGQFGSVTDGSAPLAAGQAQPQTWPSEPAAAANGTGGRYGTGDRMLPVGQLSGAQQTGYGRGVSPASQSFTSPDQPDYGQSNSAYGLSPAYGATASTYTQNLELLLAQAKAQGAAEAKIAAAAQTSSLSQAVTLTGETQEAEEPWLPLILTTLMLFASLGTNVFLGWLAWSFFWRFRDAVGDSTRAQTTLFPTRQAA